MKRLLAECSGLQLDQLIFYRFGKVYKGKIAFVIKVVLTTLVYDTYQIIVGSFPVLDDPVDFTGNK